MAPAPVTLALAGCVLLFLDVPEGTEVGMDYHMWKIGPKFKGVKFIPPGLHFVYYRYELVFCVQLIPCFPGRAGFGALCGF